MASPMTLVLAVMNAVTAEMLVMDEVTQVHPGWPSEHPGYSLDSGCSQDPGYSVGASVY